MNEHKKGLQAGKKMLYTLVWGQCKKVIHNKLILTHDYKTMRITQDSIALIKNIKNIIYSFRDNKYIPGSVWRAYHALFNIVQKNKNIKNYCKCFNNQIEIIENYVERIPIRDYLYKKNKKY